MRRVESMEWTRLYSDVDFEENCLLKDSHEVENVMRRGRFLRNRRGNILKKNRIVLANQYLPLSFGGILFSDRVRKTQTAR